MQLKKLDVLNKPYKIYASHLESGAIDQFVDTMSQPCVVQGALMPDAHSGYTLPIGGVVACEGMVFPSYVGFDIGCGMCAVPTTFKRDEVEAFKKPIFDRIYDHVPVGFRHNDRSEAFAYDGPVSDFVKKEILRAGAPGKQLGTLGQGNHFIEMGCDEADRVWIVVHSGSRNVGHSIASHYMAVASNSDKAKEGHFGLSDRSAEGKGYIADLAFGLEFALANRRAIVARTIRAMQAYTPGDAQWSELINRNHNHAEFRMLPLDGSPDHVRGVWIHRKGATHAEDGMMGVIPGNMRDGSFIVRGRGNSDSLFSSSHGAGRVLGRSKAKASLDLGEFVATMQAQGIQARVEAATLDEAPMAYKDIWEVMALQSDLVEVIHHIRPIINIKG